MKRGALIVRLLICWALLVAVSARRLTAQDSPHGKLSLPCENCHNAESWKVDRGTMAFDHGKTRFPLAGQHQALACRSCHQSLKFRDAAEQCGSCHGDVHRGELGALCERCHTPQSWLVEDMPQRHSQTRFALLGAHRTAACRECHVTQEANQFRGTPTDCYSCHRQQYEATLAPAHIPSGIGSDCASCHNIDALRWGGTFNHAVTGFPLTGAHMAVACNECHRSNRFRGTPRECIQCHQSDYNATTDPAHAAAGFSTACVPCHTTTAWHPAAFDHNASAFPLTGAHANVACTHCHASGYKGTPTDCFACHQQDYTASTNPAHATQGFSTLCQQCHSTSAWRPSTFQHDSFFPISAGSKHPPGRWNACTDCHQVAGNFQAFTCISCHEHAQATMDTKHSGVRNYQYSSPACYQCHPRGGT